MYSQYCERSRFLSIAICSAGHTIIRIKINPAASYLAIAQPLFVMIAHVKMKDRHAPRSERVAQEVIVGLEFASRGGQP